MSSGILIEKEGIGGTDDVLRLRGGMDKETKSEDGYDMEPLYVTSDIQEKDNTQGSSKAPKRNIKETCVGATEQCPEERVSPEQKRYRPRSKFLKMLGTSSGEEDTRAVEFEDDKVFRFTAKTKRGPGRLPTTGEFIRVRQTRERANKAKEEAIRLERELRLGRLPTTDIFKKARIDVEKEMGKAEKDPTGDLASQAREWMAEVVLVGKNSGNIKETFQKLLYDAAGSTLGIIETLRTRADRTDAEHNSEEIQRLRREMEDH